MHACIKTNICALGRATWLAEYVCKQFPKCANKQLLFERKQNVSYRVFTFSAGLYGLAKENSCQDRLLFNHKKVDYVVIKKVVAEVD